MSQSGHLDHGVGILKQYSIAVLTKVAEAIAGNPGFKALVRSIDPTHGIGSAQVLRVLSGYFDFPGDSTAVELLNDVFDDFIGTLATLIEEHAHDPAALDSAIKPMIEKAAAKAQSQEVFIALEQVHRSKDCLTVATYVADATPPSFTGKDGKERSNPTRARLLPTSLVEAMKAKKPLCPLCFPVSASAKADAKPEKKDEAPKPATGKSLFDSYMELKGKKPFLADEFWSDYLKASDLVKHKLTTVFGQRGSADLIESFAKLPPEQWEDALNAMLGGAQSAVVEKFSHAVVRKLGEWGDRLGNRMHAEGEEEKRFIQKVGGAIKRANDKLELKLVAPVAVPHEPETPNHWKFAALVAGFVLLVAAIVYTAHTLG